MSFGLCLFVILSFDFIRNFIVGSLFFNPGDTGEMLIAESYSGKSGCDPHNPYAVFRNFAEQSSGNSTFGGVPTNPSESHSIYKYYDVPFHPVCAFMAKRKCEGAWNPLQCFRRTYARCLTGAWPF